MIVAAINRLKFQVDDSFIENAFFGKKATVFRRSVETVRWSQKFPTVEVSDSNSISVGRSSFSLIFSRGQLLLSWFVEAGRINPSQIRCRPWDQFTTFLFLSVPLFSCSCQEAGRLYHGLSTKPGVGFLEFHGGFRGAILLLSGGAR